MKPVTISFYIDSCLSFCDILNVWCVCGFLCIWILETKIKNCILYLLEKAQLLSTDLWHGRRFDHGSIPSSVQVSHKSKISTRAQELAQLNGMPSMLLIPPVKQFVKHLP